MLNNYFKQERLFMKSIYFYLVMILGFSTLGAAQERSPHDDGEEFGSDAYMPFKELNPVFAPSPLIDDSTFEETLRKTNCFEGINISFCRNITAVGLSAIVRYCYKLQRLEIACCDNLTDQMLIDIVKNCSQLNYLDIRGQTQLHWNTLSLMAPHCSNLKFFNFARAFDGNTDPMTLASLEHLKFFKTYVPRCCIKYYDGAYKVECSGIGKYLGYCSPQIQPRIDFF
jgi:hypothetical protein